MQDSGRRGEDLAAAWLKRHRGFAIVARNWRSPRDERFELDLVATDRGALVFVEVKARALGGRVGGYFAVDRRKRLALRRAVLAYVARLHPRPRTVRCDVVEVGLAAADADCEIRHFENIPLFGRYWRP